MTLRKVRQDLFIQFQIAFDNRQEITVLSILVGLPKIRNRGESAGGDLLHTKRDHCPLALKGSGFDRVGEGGWPIFSPIPL